MALQVDGVLPTEIKVVKNGTTTSLNVYEYSTKGSDLGEATRSSVSSYTSTQLNSWVGIENDTWGAITNASSLVADKYYYIRVYVSDTGKYGKFCVKFKSASGTTITVDNMGWGYDGEVIYSTPVWGKPFSLTSSVGTNSSLTVKRTSSPNQNSILTSLASGEKVYYGDVLSITATPKNGYKLLLFIINGTNYGSGQTSAVTKTITVTGAVTVKCTTTTAASWQTVWTGSKAVSGGSITATGKTVTTALSNFGSNVISSRITRITGTMSGTILTIGSLTGSFADKELGESASTKKDIYTLSGSTGTTTSSITTKGYIDSNGISIVFGRSGTNTSLNAKSVILTITKIEQYY